jgi:hypothetical protein
LLVADDLGFENLRPHALSPGIADRITAQRAYLGCRGQ